MFKNSIREKKKNHLYCETKPTHCRNTQKQKVCILISILNTQQSEFYNTVNYLKKLLIEIVLYNSRGE